jgi:hypothetical protein
MLVLTTAPREQGIQQAVAAEQVRLVALLQELAAVLAVLVRLTQLVV